MTPPTKITLRTPTATTGKSQNPFHPPPLSFFLGTWNVTHSTLPLWKNARNVQITYAIDSPKTSINTEIEDPPYKLDDRVTYQTLTSSKIKTVSGIDSPAGPGAWNWRGRGWLMIVGTHWEVLGHGGEEDERWVVTYFSKTLFTPPGIDFYSRGKEGLSVEVVENLKGALREVDCDVVRKLAEEIFVIPRD